MKKSKKKLLGKRLLRKIKRRINYDEFQVDTLPVEFLNWVDDVIKKGELLVRYSSDKNYERRVKIFDEIIMVCIRNLLPWTNLKDSKIALLNLASMVGGKLLPNELKEFKEKYYVLSRLDVLIPYINTESILNIKMALDNDLIAKAISIGYLTEIDERLQNFYKGHRKVFLKTGGHPKIPFLNAILIKCNCAFDNKINKITGERIAQFVNAIFLYDIVGGKEPDNLIKLRIKSIVCRQNVSD